MNSQIGKIVIEATLSEDRNAEVRTEMNLNQANAIDITELCCSAAAAALTIIYTDMLAGATEQGVIDSLEARKAVLRHLLPLVGNAFFSQMDDNLGTNATIH